MRSLWLLLFTAISSFSILWAQSNISETNAHLNERSTGRFSLTLDNNNLYVELFLPALPVAGFDHLPEDPESEEKIKKILIRLENNDFLFTLPKIAECFLINSYSDYLSSERSYFESANEAETILTEEEASIPDDASAEESDDSADDTDQDDVSSENDEIDKKVFEFYVTYEFRCKYPDKVVLVPLTLFDSFPNITNIIAYTAVQGKENETVIPQGTGISLR